VIRDERATDQGLDDGVDALDLSAHLAGCIGAN
jgi:hypothetical protein